MDAALEQRLSGYSEAVRMHLPAYATAVDELVSRLTANQAGEASPRPGEPMPSFALPDENGHIVHLDALLKKGPVAINFHRGHWCPWCRISAAALAEVKNEIRRVGSEVIAILPERQKFALEFKAQTRSPFPVLTDMDNGYAMSLNLAIWLGDELQKLLTAFGRSLPTYQGNETWILPIPATFVVAKDGIISARFLDPDFRRRASVESLLDALKTA